jgi:glutamate racemase
MCMQEWAPVGVFDSGVGGLGTLRALMRHLPGEDFIYYGDNANAPYGVLTEERIRALTFQCVDFLLHQGVKCVVIACNTASSAAVQAVRARYALPIVAMEPAVRTAAAALKRGKALVMATPATLRQGLFQRRVDECGIRERVLPLPCPRLVELVEAGVLDGPEIEGAIAGYLMPYREQSVDVVVLGCTHFSHIRAHIERLARLIWPDARVVDGDEGTAQQLQRVLREHGLINPREGGGKVTLHTSGDAEILMPLFERLLRRG